MASAWRIDDARKFYAAALPNYREQSLYSSGAQPLPITYGNQLKGLTKFTLGTSALVGAGFIPVRGSNVFNRLYMPGIRAFENYFPGNITRTLQFSSILSQFENPALASRAITGNALSDSPLLRQYFASLTGLNFHDPNVFNKGLVFHKGSLFHGSISEDGIQLGDRLLEHAAVIRNPIGAARFSEGIAAALRVKLPGATLHNIWHPIHGTRGVFAQPLSFINEAGKEVAEGFQIIGAKSKLGLFSLQARGYGAYLAERMNIISRSLHEFIPESIHHLAKEKLGLNLSKMKWLGVEPGPASEVITKLAGKWSLLAGGAYLGYDLLDTTLDKVGLSPTKLAGRFYAGGRIAYARAGEISGLSNISKYQEEKAPGSTSLMRLAGIPAVGAFTAGTASYFHRIGKQIGFQRSGLTAEEAGLEAMEWARSFGKGHSEWLNRVAKFIEEHGMGFLSESPLRLKMMMGAGVGLLAVAPFIPGALLPQTSSQELKDIYEGREEVPIRKGRWWEFGRTAFWGGGVSYYRPHALAVSESNAKDISIYGKRRSALSKFFISNFTYDLERKHYQDRPYPVTGSAFESIPFVGPILAATIGKVAKPELYMHQDEFMKSVSTNSLIGSNEQFKYLPPGFRQHRATELGEFGPGAPISPTGFKATVSEQWHRFKEMFGLPGFFMGTLVEKALGTGLFEQETRLQSARTMYGASRDIWDRELGGMGPTGELVRRLFPRPHTAMQFYNPISNTMPYWLPSEGDRSPDFRHGDPYTKVPMGEIRLPGEGYVALHPELKGLSPSQYPDIYKLQILADVAPYSSKYTFYKSLMTEKKRAGKLSKQEQEMYKIATGQAESIRDKKEFHEYLYKGKIPLNPVELAGKYWELLSHHIESPLEFLTPMSPGAKFVHMRTAREDYERSIVYGTESSFWTHPIRDFYAPFVATVAHMAGYQGIPPHVKNVRGIEDYFDTLKYVKYERLKRVAGAAHDSYAAAYFGQRTSESLIGVNPYTQNYSDIYRALPRRDRDYFKTFSAEVDPEERVKILKLVPENERGLYLARWEMTDAQNLQKLIKKGQLSATETAKADKFINSVYDHARTEGLPTDKNLFREYLETREKGESYAEWYRRTKILENKLSGVSLPGPDWVGWHPSVDLDDIKLKLVTNVGADTHEYDLWPSDQMDVARRPYINDQAAQALTKQPMKSPIEVRAKIRELLGDHNLDTNNVAVSLLPGAKPSYNISLDVEQDYSGDPKKVMDRGI